jgi:hypothetical protein
MQAIRDMGSYMYDGAKYIVNEAWQLGADATSEAGNIVSEFYCNLDTRSLILRIFV